MGLADYHVGVLHAALQDNPAWKIRPNDLPISRTEIAASGLHYLALGHYHNFAEVREGGSVAVYPGTLEGKKFGENGPRYLVTATLSRDAISIERTQWNVRTLHEAAMDLNLADVRDEDQLEARILAYRRRSGNRPRPSGRPGRLRLRSRPAHQAAPAQVLPRRDRGRAPTW